MGQLFDYSVRYRAKLGEAVPMLAFGTMPRNDVAWISEILEGSDVGFLSMEAGNLRPLNQSARLFPLFD